MERCQTTPCVASPALQRLLQERLDLCISVSQLNRVRASLGLSRKLLPREKKPKNGLSIEPGYHEQVGGLLLLAAATETGLLTQLEKALPTGTTPAHAPLAGSSAVAHQR